MPAPSFGSQSAYADAFPSPPPKNVTVSAETCFNLNVFKDMMRQYRKLDDQVIIRLNRAQAQLRDQSRSTSSSSSNATLGAEGMCTQMWLEVMSCWAHRQTLLTFCLGTVKNSLDEKKAVVKGIDERLSAGPSLFSSSQSASSSSFPNRTRPERGWKEEQVLADQLENEHSVEAIIRKRTLDAFKSRCPFFTPPPGTSRQWWDLADSAVPLKSPDPIANVGR